jgi:predicted nucleotide-binding protein (sugar kinase/HSP70/actin superfamily)
MLQARAGTVGGPELSPKHELSGKKVIIPPMAYGSARAFAAGFRAIGIDADITPPSDHRTRELGSKCTSGDECYPAKVTVGDFMKYLERPDSDPCRTVLFMPTADGPCRFGQYAPYLRRILESNGYGSTRVLSPTSANSYDGLGELAGVFVRTQWRALLSADILSKLLLQYRPYELQKGEADSVYEHCLGDLCSAIESTPTSPGVQLRAIRDSLVRCRDRFRALAVHHDRSLPLIGVVGEIFCRLNTFSNEDLVRRLEEYGAECWLSDLTEWVWYTNAEQFRRLKLLGKQISKQAAGAWIRKTIQKRDEDALLEPFQEDFAGYEEPEIHEVLEHARPYLPVEGALGEMVISVGRAICLAKKGADGIIDISPFTCMNGIVCEAVYPRVSRDLDGIPIRSFYFDGTQSDLDRDMGVYLELARTYQKRKKHARRFPKAHA